MGKGPGRIVWAKPARQFSTLPEESPTFAELYSGEWAHPRCSGCLR